MKKRLEAIVFGRVQGVNFRFFSKHWAQKFGLNGFVSNQGNGTVKLVAEGEEEKLKELLKKVLVGPPTASVEKVKDLWKKNKFEFASFEIRF